MKRRSPDQLALDLGGSDSAGPAAPAPVEGGTEPPPSPAGDAPAPAPPGGLPDADARRRIAEDLDVSLLVEAGAGSGKTTALVSRMVALVREGTAEVGEIAAVTFTRKAAGELRERFQEALEQERTRKELDEPRRLRLERALVDLDRSFMGTIHAFCARLLRERPLEAGVDPGFSELTAPEANVVAARYWRLHLERLAASGDPLLGELEDVGIAPVELRRLYDVLRDNLDVETPVEGVPPPDPATVASVRHALDGILDDARRFIRRDEPPSGWDDLQRRLRSVDYVRRYRAWPDDRVFLDALAEICSRRSWKITQYKWSDDAAGKTAAKAVLNRVNELVAGPAQNLLDEWWAYRYPVAVRFARGAAEALEGHRLAAGTLDFQDLLRLAARLLRESPVARRDLGRRWARLLVDEFQDTDPIQAEVVFLLTSDPELDGGDWTKARPRPGSLFVVGDPKQSIYRFRRADISLYMLVRRRFRELGRVESLVANFRSGEPIAELVNGVFSPPDGFPEEATPLQAAFAPLLPQPGRHGRGREGVFQYEVLSDASNKDAITDWGAAALADWISARTGPGGDRTPGDFLVLTRKKEPLEAYARALEARNLPVQVSGAGVGVQEEVSELRFLLEALVDPDDPSRTVSVLVGLFFGLDLEQLLEHREGGRGFDFRMARDEDDEDPVEAALARMRRWWVSARTEPADVVVGRIATELGLVPYAAAGELGAIRAGALAFVLDAVRGAGLAGDTSLAGALEALEAALQDDEAEAPLQPGRSDQVRLMNVHKAKGLEGRIVILAAPVGEWDHPIDHHIERTPEGRARGWFHVERRDGRSTRILARPKGWAERERAERAFAAAEDLRLLYVAATRAEEELVVARHPPRPEISPWQRLHEALDARATPLELTPSPPPARERVPATAEEIEVLVGEAEARRGAASHPTHAFTSVTGLVKGADPAEKPHGLPAPLPPVDTVGGPGGYAWGSAVHGVLEAAARGARGRHLRSVGRSLLLELDRPLSGGEPVELDELLATCEAVLGSDLWGRSRRAEQVLAEVPFALEVDGAPAAETPSPATWLEGVLDLAFREHDGWVIVDYKTDRGDDPAFDSRRARYHRQLALYARAWARLTGESVKERLLWFVRQGVVEEVRADADGPGASTAS